MYVQSDYLVLLDQRPLYIGYTLEITGIKCLLLYKKPLRDFIINLFIAKLINAVISTESLSLDTCSGLDGCMATNALHFYFHPTSLAFR